jgi:hypothetical protein
MIGEEMRGGMGWGWNGSGKGEYVDVVWRGGLKRVSVSEMLCDIEWDSKSSDRETIGGYGRPIGGRSSFRFWRPCVVAR